MERLITFWERIYSQLSIPSMRWPDYLEIVIIAFLIYEVLTWVKNTKAWSLMRGIVVIGGFIFVAYVFQMNTILWLVRNASVVAITALIVVFQPELRKALETLGKRNTFMQLLGIGSTNRNSADFSENTIMEISKACYEMGRARTGALIVVAREDSLREYESTGIELDSVITSQLLINIFEHNTPLHDGAVIVQGNRISAATCYLPLSDNMELSKELGTRHRAGVGISEATDSVTVIVSEETGRISVAVEGELYRNLSSDELREKLLLARHEVKEERKFFKWKGREKNEG